MKKIMLGIMLTLSLVVNMFTLPAIHAEEAEDPDPVADPRPVKYMQPMIVDENGNVIQEYVEEFEDETAETRASIHKTAMTGIYYKAHNSKTGWTYYGQMTRLYIDGELAYCLDPATEVDTSANYKSSSLDTYMTNDSIRNKVLLYAFYGYSFTGHQTNKYYCAAQELIWEALSSNWSVSFTTTFNGDTAVSVTSQKNAIKKLVQEHYVTPSFSKTDVKLTVGQPSTITDENGVLSKYTVSTDNPDITLEQNDNELTISAAAPLPDGATIKLKKEFSETNYAFAYKASGSQTVGVIHGFEPLQVTFNITVDYPTGKLSFLKTGPAFTKTETEDTPYGTMVKPIFEEVPLTDATISIYAAEDIVVDGTVTYHKDELIQTLTSTKDRIESQSLDVGQYYYVEDAAPEGYIKDEQKHAFAITEDGGPDGSYVVTSALVNALPTVELAYTKHLQESDVPIEDAYQKVVFGVYSRTAILDVEGQEAIAPDTLVAMLHMDDKGQIVDAPRLPEGDYYLKELETHPGYVLDEQEYDFTIDVSGGSNRIVIGGGEVIENQLKEYTVQVNKVDSQSGNPIVSSMFNFSRYADEACTVKLEEAIVNTTQGTATFDHVHYGVSYIKETQAPKGYRLSSEVVKVEVKEDGVYINDVLQQTDDGIYSFTCLNTMLPATGDHSDLTVWYIGIAAAMSGMVGLITLKKRGKKPGSDRL